MPAGGSTTLTAQATLTNAAAVAPGTPSSIPVLVQQTTDPICSATPPGAQPSGAQFVLSAIAAGTCTVTIGADPSGVPGATADTTTLAITVTGPPSATPTPPSCDLIQNGKCYHRIVGPTAQLFHKHVVPDDNCSTDGQASCNYIDSIKQIFLEPGYPIQPPVPPVDSSHELLIRIDSIVGALKTCLPYAAFATVPIGTQIPWGSGDGTGGPVDPPTGFGAPAVYTIDNHIIGNFVPSGVLGLGPSWDQATTLSELFASVATRNVGQPFSFAYYAGDAGSQAYLLLQPDFPGCDAAGDPNHVGVEYGDAAILLLLEIYQAVP
jgi:hypothetical protein